MTTVLFADDEYLVRQSYADILGDKGYHVVACEDGQSAVECCRKFMPDLIILDINMPNVNGLCACEQIRALPGGEKVPIIFISGELSEDEMNKNLESGANLALCKPVAYNTLLTCISDLLAKR